MPWPIKKRGATTLPRGAEQRLPSSLFKLLNVTDSPFELLCEVLEEFEKLEKAGDSKGLSIPTEEIRLLAPLDKVATYRDCYTHEKHVARGFKKRGEKIPEAWYEIPAYYKGATAAIRGPGEEILWPAYTKKLDYELELAMVLGREGKNIHAKDAHKYIFGFTILNDISARDIQGKEMSVRLGPAKGKDFCTIIGPVITTLDEFESDNPNLLMQAFINGDEWSRGRSGEAHYSWGEIISHVSMDEWVLPGDLFGSGTVGSGCGLELDKWISPGDEIELKIESIGSLVNKVGKPNA